MKKLLHIRGTRPVWTLCLPAIVIALIFSTESFAQKRNYKAGEKIEYKASYSKDEWAEGTFVEQSYDGSQPIIRDAQNFQKGLPDWTWIRPINARPQPANATPALEPTEGDQPAATGGGLMSQADIISFLKTNLGADPFANPRRYEIKTRLAQEIKRRGLDFHFETLSDFFSDMSKYIGVDSEISFPLKDNFGPPTKQSWLLGTWRLDKIGATTDFERNGYIYRKEASGAANVGSITIGNDGNYIWRANTPAATFRGGWRKATAEEMKTQGGDGIVLLNAKSGYDWIVIQNRAWKGQGDLIWISDLSTRQVREIGWR